MQALASWLTDKFREWEKSTGRRQNVTSFARYLGVKQPSLTRWMSGDNPPDYGNAQKLASKLGYEIYDILGMVRPDSEDYQRSLAAVPPEYKKLFEKDLEEFTLKWLRDHGVRVDRI